MSAAWIRRAPLVPGRDLVRRVAALESSGPYLKFASADARARTIDPDSLPERTSPRRRIVFVVAGLSVGGVERVTETAARVLSETHEVWIWVPTRARVLAATRVGDARIVGGDEADLVRFAQIRRIDVAVSNNGAMMGAIPALARNGTASIVLLHGLSTWNAQIIARDEAAFQAARAVWTFPAVGGALAELGFDVPCYEFRVPIDLGDWAWTPRAWAPPFRVAYLGRISGEKNLPAVLDLWAALRDRLGDDVRFEFVGGPDPRVKGNDGIWTRAAKEEIRRSPIWRRLEAADVLTDRGLVDDVAPLLRDVHFVALASDYEGQPVALVEAQASGAIGVYRDVGEVAALLRGAGVLVPARGRRMDSIEIAQAADGIATLTRFPEACDRIARAARARIERRHEARAWAAGFVRIVEDILAGGTG